MPSNDQIIIIGHLDALEAAAEVLKQRAEIALKDCRKARKLVQGDVSTSRSSQPKVVQMKITEAIVKRTAKRISKMK